MLIGKNNPVNRTLVEKLVPVLSIQFVDYTDLLKNPAAFAVQEPQIALVNLMDLGSVETELLQLLKLNFPNLKIVAIHSFQSEILIEKTLAKGYDSYISIFDISENIASIFEEFALV